MGMLKRVISALTNGNYRKIYILLVAYIILRRKTPKV